MSLPEDERETDAMLVHAVLSAQPRAFERLLQSHHRLVWLLVQRLVREPETARELCQEVFLRVSQQLHQFRFESRLSTWIGRIATSVALRHLEKKRIETVEFLDAHDAPLDEAHNPAQQLDAAQRLAALRDAIDALPPLVGLCITLVHLQEQSVAEVAQLTGLPEGTVKSHLHRGRERLCRHLEALA